MFDKAALAAVPALLRGLDQDVDDAMRIDRIRLLEELKSAAAAAQARETAAFAASQRAAATAARAERVARSVAGQVGLARRISPYQARRYVGWASILVTELPCTFAALQDGRVSEWRAMLVARETIWLSREHRAIVDAELAPRLEQFGDRRAEAETRKLAYRLDPAGYVERARAAEKDRRVGLRPAPDTMAQLSALLPAAQGVAAYTALSREADTRVGQGDPRPRGQIMADTLVERVTGQTGARNVPIEINVVMTDADLLDPGNTGDADAAQLEGYGPVPAGLARRLIEEADDSTRMWIRRLFTRPDTGQLVAMESSRRFFGVGQRRFVRARDQYCRTSWCEAPIRHIDHVTPAARGGPTHVEQAQGYCEACNYTKEAPGWSARVVPGPAGNEIETRTPTGHRYRSRPPDPPGDRAFRWRRASAPPIEITVWRHAA